MLGSSLRRGAKVFARHGKKSFHTVPTKVNNIMFTTGEDVCGHDITEDLGMVVGAHSYNRSIFGDIRARIRMYIGGEVLQYSEAVDQVASAALSTMAEEAEKSGASAIVNVRFECSETVDPLVWSNNFSYCIAYGSMVKTKRISQ